MGLWFREAVTASQELEGFSSSQEKGNYFYVRLHITFRQITELNSKPGSARGVFLAMLEEYAMLVVT